MHSEVSKDATSLCTWFYFPFRPSTLINKPKGESVDKKYAHQEVKTETKRQMVI